MRLIAISLMILAGAIMAAAGVIADAIDAKHNYDVDLWGIGVVVMGGLLLIAELLSSSRNSQTETRIGT